MGRFGNSLTLMIVTETGKASNYPEGLPRIGVIGGAGRLGQALVKAWTPVAEMIPVGRSAIDLRDSASITGYLGSHPLDLVVLTAALTAVDYCETHGQEAFEVNAEGPREVARICAEAGIKVVMVSTDFVFDGAKPGPYLEDDAISPISVYGASKRKGEEYVLQASPDNLVVRVAWLYGAERPAFPEWIIQQATTQDALSLPGEKLGTPTSCEDLSEYLLPLLGLEGRESATGVVHLCNTGSCTWQEWGQFCLDTAAEAGVALKTTRIDANSMSDIAAFIAPRPVNGILSTGRFTQLTGITPRPWQEALREHILAKYSMIA